MKRHNKFVFVVILLLSFFMLIIFPCSAFTNSQREGVAEWKFEGEVILSDGITEYEPYLIDGERIDLTTLGYELTNKLYYYNNTVNLDGEEYEVCAAYDFSPVVFLEAISPNDDFVYPTYAYYAYGDSSILDNFLGGSYEKVRAICYDSWDNIAFDISDSTLFNMKNGIDCTKKVIHMSELDTDWYWLYGFDKTDILAKRDTFLFKNGEDWCYLDTSIIPDNYFYADGSLALDKDLNINVQVLTGVTKSDVEQAANNTYFYEIISETESNNPFDNLYDRDWTEEETRTATSIIVVILGIVIPVGLGVYSTIDILILKKGKRNISSYIMAAAEALWLVCGVVFLIVLLI